MKIKTIVNDKGEVQGTSMQLGIDVISGHFGLLATEGLVKQMNTFKCLKTESELYLHKALTYGYIFCCQDCGLITKESGDELLGVIDMLMANELARVQGDGTHGK